MKTRALAHRDMTTRPLHDVAGRLAFVAYVASPVLGLFGLGWGVSHRAPVALTLGAIGVLGFALLHVLARPAYGFGGIVDEIKRNPFKRPRPATEGSTTECPNGSCGVL